MRFYYMLKLAVTQTLYLDIGIMSKRCYNNGMNKNTVNETDVRFTLRVPPETYEMLKQIAEKERRSVNSLIVILCEQGVKAYRVAERPY